MSGAYTVGIDIGGTFTDVVITDRAGGTPRFLKVPSTPRGFGEGFITGVRRALQAAGAAPGQLGAVRHATTVATNALLQARGCNAALVTTRGFRHVLHIARHDVPPGENLFRWVRGPRPIPAADIFEVDGRLAASGDVLQPITPGTVREVAARIVAGGYASVAICLLNAHADPRHEIEVAQALRAEGFTGHLVRSTRVLPVVREYERCMATALTAWLAPEVTSYVAELEGRLAGMNIDAPLEIMQSNGGMMTAAEVQQRPLVTAMSGPAAGVVGAVRAAEACGIGDIITLDIGGTSADVALIRAGTLPVTRQRLVGDFEVGLPMLDIETIGAGGGSIASVDDHGALSVGPASAGSDPGPACYGRGATHPTVTDANLVLGRVPHQLAGGLMRLDAECARRALGTHVGKALGIDEDEAAAGVLAMLTSGLVGAVRRVSVERGIDPSDYALVAYGGAGPLHATEVAASLGISTVVIPPQPGVLSALGLITSDMRHDALRTVSLPVDERSRPALRGAVDTLVTEAQRWVESYHRDTGAAPRHQWTLDMRYVNQGEELPVPVSGLPELLAGDPTGWASRLRAAFEEVHTRLFGFTLAAAPVEVVTLGLQTVISAAHGQPAPAGPDTGGAPPRWPRREVWFLGHGTVSAPVVQRDRVPAQTRMTGPLVLEQNDSTVVVSPGFDVHFHPSGSVVLREQGQP